MRPDNSLLKDLALVCTHLAALKGKKPFRFPVPDKSCPTFTRGEGKLRVGRTGIVSSPLCPQDTIGLKSRGGRNVVSPGNVARCAFLKQTRLSGSGDKILHSVTPAPPDTSIRAAAPLQLCDLLMAPFFHNLQQKAPHQYAGSSGFCIPAFRVISQPCV